MQNPRPAREPWDRNQEPAEESTGSGISYMVILLILLAAVVVCITGIFVARILLPMGSLWRCPAWLRAPLQFPR